MFIFNILLSIFCWIMDLITLAACIVGVSISAIIFAILLGWVAFACILAFIIQRIVDKGRP